MRFLPDVRINMYADDCILYTVGNNWNQVRACLQVGLIGFDDWCRNNSMVLNISKSKCLLVASKINADLQVIQNNCL